MSLPVACAPCGECPFRRKSLPGWLGTVSNDRRRAAEDYAASAHGDGDIPCHMSPGFLAGDAARMRSCAGLAVYRRNVAKLPRDPGGAAAVAAVQADRGTVFSTKAEFVEHHARDLVAEAIG